jgi:hypothetical protein
LSHEAYGLRKSRGSDFDGIALAIERYEFRTQASAPLPFYGETALRLRM